MTTNLVRSNSSLLPDLWIVSPVVVIALAAADDDDDVDVDAAVNVVVVD